MNKISFRLTAAAIAAAVATIATATLAQEMPPCRTGRVTYSPWDERFAERMTVQSAPRATLITSDKESTNQGTRWMVVRRPNYITEGPWATGVWIGGRSASSLLQLAFLDHASGGVEIHWLNEKLL